MDYRERARDYIELALDNFNDKSSLAHKSAIDLLNLIDPDTAVVQQEQELRGKGNTRARYRSKSACGPRARSRKRGVDATELFRRSNPVDIVISWE